MLLDLGKLIRMRKLSMYLALVLFTQQLPAQTVGIGTITPNSSAQLDVSSTTKGMLIPRMTTVQRSNIASPATGLIVFDTDTNSLWWYTGSSWFNSSAITAWSLSGNSGTNPAT